VRRSLRVLSIFGIGLLALALAALLAGDRPGLAGALTAAGAILSVLAEALLWRRRALWRALKRLQADATMRAGLRDVLLVGVVAGAQSLDRDQVALALPTLVVVWALRLTTIMVQRETVDRRAVPVSWRNFEVAGVRRSVELGPGALSDASTWPSSGSLPLAVGVAATLMGAPEVCLTIGAVVSVAIAALVTLLAVVDYFRARRDTSAEETVDRLADALAEYAPEVVLYYSRPEAIGYIANVWMKALEQLPRRVVVLVREAHNAKLVETDKVPVIRVTRATDLERVVPSSVALALYPSNVAKNNHLLRLPDIFDVFVGHGDSDKGGSATALTRIFDEAWVSGPAARDRYRIAAVGVRDEQIREVGRPQLAEIDRHAAPLTESHGGTDGLSNWEYTVLYAPTREGFFAAWEYSSVLTQGAGILQALIGMPGVRVLFKPHPGTGTDNRLYRLEVERLITMVESAGGPHEVVTGSEGLYQAFNRADLLVSDVSSVITDFLASGKPYVVTNSAEVSDKEFRRAFPSARGAYILSGDGSAVEAFVADARTADSLAQPRRDTAEYLLGDTSLEPLARFNEAVETVLKIERMASSRRL
jgi:CDP-Glycerol:Poly(glycerophosphate) glycerophosphotransferase